MSRYIDADALIRSIENDRNCSDMPSQWIDGVNYAIDLIELYAPTIGAVEVVRCKDCKYWDPWHCSQFNDHTHEVDYCSYGERKESE